MARPQSRWCEYGTEEVAGVARRWQRTREHPWRGHLKKRFACIGLGCKRARGSRVAVEQGTRPGVPVPGSLKGAKFAGRLHSDDSGSTTRSGAGARSSKALLVCRRSAKLRAAAVKTGDWSSSAGGAVAGVYATSIGAFGEERAGTGDRPAGRQRASVERTCRS
jgi:hypothetical protein